MRTIARIFILFVVIILQPSLDIAQEEKEVIQTIEGQDYYIHTIMSGETLYGISKKYNVKIEDIKKSNILEGDNLRLGEKIRIPAHIIAIINETGDKDVFITHQVKRNETLYSISKRYDVKISEIIKYNAGAKEGLKQGQLLKIPGKNLQAVKASPEVNKDSLILHTIKEGETLYGLSKEYEVSIDAIKANNKNLIDGFHVGDNIWIPARAESVNIQTGVSVDTLKVLKDSVYYKKEVYDIGLMLPFYCDINDSLNRHRKPGKVNDIYKRSIVAIQFYEGALLAIDSLRKLGVSVRLYIYDTAKDSAAMQSILSKPELNSMNLIIGPLYKSNFIRAADFAKKHHIPIVSPVPQSNKILLGNAWVSKVTPSSIIQMEEISRYVTKNYSNENLILIHVNDQEQHLYERCRFICNSTLQSIINKSQDSITEIRMNTVSEQMIKNALSQTKKNIIILPSVNQVFVSDFLTKLHKLNKNNKDNFIVFGSSEWLNFDNLDVNYLHGLHIHIPLTIRDDFTDTITNKMVTLFRKRYKTNPDKYGILGYDVMYYYLNGLQQYGINFQAHLDEYKYNGLGVRFDFFKTSLESGFENRAVCIATYQDFSLIPVNW